MRAKMLRKLIKWFIQDIFLGTIPLIIHCLILIVIRQRISIILLSAELFFLNIEILISAYKKISKLEWNHRNEEILSETQIISIILLVLSSMLYGCIIIIDYIGIILNESALCIIVVGMTGLCVSIGIGTNYIAVREEREQ